MFFLRSFEFYIAKELLLISNLFFIQLFLNVML